MNTRSFLLYTVLLTYCIYTTVANSSKSDDPLLEDLGLFSGAGVEDWNYELVKFRHREIQSGTENEKELRFKRSGKDVIWKMKETSVIRTETPVWLVYNDSNIVKAHTNIINDAVRFYEDPNLSLSVATSFDEYNHMYFVGSIGDARLAPLSKRTVRSILKDKPHLVEEQEWTDESEEFIVSDYHLLYTLKSPKSGKIILPPMGSAELFRKPDLKPNGTSYDRLKRSNAETVYPKVLAILDYDQKYTTIYEARFLNLMMYTINFWNSVNLRFSTLKDPRIQLRLSGIVVNMERGALSLIKENIPSGMLNIGVRWFSSGWVESTIPEATFDIILLQTNLKLCQQQKGGACEHKGILGNANIGPECREGWNVMSGIVNDNMAYGGIHTAAHEVGHMLGASHDGLQSPEDCAAEKGYIMSWDHLHKDRSFEWSRCSKESISERLRSRIGNCLDNDNPIAVQGELVDEELLPGTRHTQDMQCQDKGWKRACKSSDVCQSLLCESWWLWCTNAGPPLDGTHCPNNGQCKNGKCVSKNQN